VLHLGGQKVWVLYRKPACIAHRPIPFVWVTAKSRQGEWEKEWMREKDRLSACTLVVQNYEHAADSFTLLFNTGVTGFCSQDNMMLWRRFHLSSVLKEMLIRYSLLFHLFWGLYWEVFLVNMAVVDRYWAILVYFQILNDIFWVIIVVIRVLTFLLKK